ncbi:phage head spike fiber domain-containing protein [Sinomicrobium sp.]
MKLSELGQYKTVTDLGLKQKREELLAEATLSLDFANNRYEVYEGPVNSLTQKPFNDILTFTRGSAATAWNATGGITDVLTDEQRLVGNREGLLIEEQRTNFATGNNDLAEYLNYPGSLYSGNTTRTTVADSGLTPNFTIAGLDLTANSDGNVSASIEDGIVDVTKNYALSAYFLPGNADSITLDTTRTSSGSFLARVTLDLNTGLVTGVGAGLGTFGAREVNGGWWYLYVTRPAGMGTGAAHISVSGKGLISGESIRVAAINAEIGLYPTTHIPTFGSQVTRVADDCSRTLGAEFRNDKGRFIVTAKAPVGKTILAAGTLSIVSDSEDLKEYDVSYDSDIEATDIQIVPSGNGVVESIYYLPTPEAN